MPNVCSNIHGRIILVEGFKTRLECRFDMYVCTLHPQLLIVRKIMTLFWYLFYTNPKRIINLYNTYCEIASMATCILATYNKNLI